MFVVLHCDYHNFLYNDVISTAAITVQFSPAVYTVDEGGPSFGRKRLVNDEFTLLLSGPAEREIVVTLTIFDGACKSFFCLPLLNLCSY